MASLGDAAQTAYFAAHDNVELPSLRIGDQTLELAALCGASRCVAFVVQSCDFPPSRRADRFASCLLVLHRHLVVCGLFRGTNAAVDGCSHDSSPEWRARRIRWV